MKAADSFFLQFIGSSDAQIERRARWQHRAWRTGWSGLRTQLAREETAQVQIHALVWEQVATRAPAPAVAASTRGTVSKPCPGRGSPRRWRRGLFPATDGHRYDRGEASELSLVFRGVDLRWGDDGFRGHRRGRERIREDWRVGI